ncbi:MAG: alkaline phosphatase family protein, partial [Bacteroidota bacterium]|nr:alkaline phosphatase family protein [Bacteroidota bacterium]
PNLTNTLGEIVAQNGMNQLRIAETEKYAHVTFFFSGGREKVFDNEERSLVQSPKVATYDLKPEMSAFGLKDKVVKALNTQKYDLVILNFANGDMVGHTGIYDAILKAVNSVDKCLTDVVETAKKNNYASIIIADHGNADFVINDDGSANTQHSLNPVPCILVDDDRKNIQIKDGILADVAPTICEIMNLKRPTEMTGKVLIK